MRKLGWDGEATGAKINKEKIDLNSEKFKNFGQWWSRASSQHHSIKPGKIGWAAKPSFDFSDQKQLFIPPESCKKP